MTSTQQGSPDDLGNDRGTTRRDLLALSALGTLAGSATSAAAQPQGQITWGMHISLTPNWFDPTEGAGLITPYVLLYALHDALVKPMPGTRGCD